MRNFVNRLSGVGHQVIDHQQAIEQRHILSLSDVR
jgi:hypothetical protein